MARAITYSLYLIRNSVSDPTKAVRDQELFGIIPPRAANIFESASCWEELSQLVRTRERLSEKQRVTECSRNPQSEACRGAAQTTTGG